MLADIPQNDRIKLYVYADDITITTYGKDIRFPQKSMMDYLKIFFDWASSWGLKINPGKTYIQHYTKKKIPCPILQINNKTIKYKKTHRVLGMILDSPTLSWKDHIKELISDCRKRLDIMKIISSPVWGACLKTLRHYYIAYVRSKIDYGSILYDKSHQPSLDKLDVIQNTAMRLMTGARSTSPILSLQVECNLPPLKIHRGYLIAKNYSKLLYKSHNFETTSDLGLDRPINERAPFNSFKFKAKFWCTTFKIPKIKRSPIPLLSPIPPWTSLLPYLTNFYNYEEINSNEKFINYINQKFPNFQPIYTDGSKTNPDSSVACAIFSPLDNKIFSWKLHNQHSVLGSELFAIDKALQYIQKYYPHTNSIILTDSKTSLHLIQNQYPKTYKAIVFSIQSKIILLNQACKVQLHWVKGHSGITGNEKADEAANAGHKNIRTELFPLTHSENISLIKENFASYWTEYWVESSNMTSKGLFLQNLRSGNLKKNSLIFNALNRREQVLLQRLRISHA